MLLVDILKSFSSETSRQFFFRKFIIILLFFCLKIQFSLMSLSYKYYHFYLIFLHLLCHSLSKRQVPLRKRSIIKEPRIQIQRQAKTLMVKLATRKKNFSYSNRGQKALYSLGRQCANQIGFQRSILRITLYFIREKKTKMESRCPKAWLRLQQCLDLTEIPKTL